MTMIRDVLHLKDTKEQSTPEGVATNKALYLCFQQIEQINTQYLATSKGKVEVCKSAGIPRNLKNIA